ncbi:MAG: aldehyde dehydrogenase family protein [Nocardioides sp.]|uniref:aldehyde dehydrogenase family protein n=1 Tax=Nocardioides sp. TaxID=35761 RepID=UPI003F01395E
MTAGATPTTARPTGAGEPQGSPAWPDAESLDRWSSWVRSGVEPSTQSALAPFTLEETAPVPVSTTDDVREAVRTARTAQQEWAARPLRERSAVVLAFHDLLLSEQEQVLDLIQWETGKARFHAWQEVGQVVAIARHYAQRTRHYLKPTKLRGMVPGATVVKEVRVPKGGASASSLRGTTRCTSASATSSPLCSRATQSCRRRTRRHP